MNPKKFIPFFLIFSSVQSETNGYIISTTAVSTTVPLPECDQVTIEYKRKPENCTHYDFNLQLEISGTGYSFRKKCRESCSDEYNPVIEISKESVNVGTQSRYIICDDDNGEIDSRYQTLKGRSLTISSVKTIKWDVHISDNCNGNQIWRLTAYIGGGVAAIFLLTTLCLAIYILYLKLVIRGFGGEPNLKKLHIEMAKSNEMPSQRKHNVTYDDTTSPDFKDTMPSFLRSNQFAKGSQPNTPQSTRRDAEVRYTNPPAVNSTHEPVYANLSGTKKGNNHVYEPMPGARMNSEDFYEAIPGLNEHALYANLPGARY